MWVAATGSVTAPFVPYRIGVQSIPPEFGKHRYLTKGEATRFEALLVQYLISPEVTRRRLYLETMEEILPGVEKVVVEPNTVNLLPMLPLGRQTPAVGAAQ